MQPLEKIHVHMTHSYSNERGYKINAVTARIDYSKAETYPQSIFMRSGFNIFLV